MASRTSPVCTTGVEFELCKSFLPNFAGTVKFVAKIMVGMVPLCTFGVVQDWYCLIGSLVIWRGHVTCVFVANALYVAFIYMYISLACSYMVFIYQYVRHTCLCVMCALCLLSMTRSHMRDSSMCNMVCCRYDNPTSAPIGDPSMVILPWGLVEACYFGMLVVLAPMHHTIFSLLWYSS